MFRCVTLAGLIGVGMYTGDEGRVPLDRLRDARRGAEHHLRRAAAARRHGDHPRAAPRQLLGLAGATALRGIPRDRDAVPDGRPALLGRARLLDPAAGKPLPLLDAVDRRSGCCSPSSPAASIALVAMPALRSRRGSRRRSRPSSRSASSRWNLTGEIGAAAGTNSISRTAAATLRHPFTWVDDITHQQPTIYLGEGEADQNPEWMLEFWNRSIVAVGSLDGTVGGPGPAGSPNLDRERTHATGPAIRRTPASSTPTPSRTGRASTSPARIAARTTTAPAAAAKAWRLIQLTASEPRCAPSASASTRTAGAARPTASTSASPRARAAGCASSSRAATGAARPDRARCTILLAPLAHPPHTPAGAQPNVTRDDRPVDRQRADEGVLADARRPTGSARPSSSTTSSSRTRSTRRRATCAMLGAEVDYGFFRKAPAARAAQM